MANTPPIFQYSNYPSSYEYNEGKIVKSNHEIIKKIEIEKNFSDYVSLDMRSKRYGINPCCTFDQLESSIIKKEVCDWQDKVKPIFTKEYDHIVWPLNTEPIPEWVQWGDFNPAIGPCINNDCPKYKDPYGSSEWFSFRINMNLVQTAFTPDGTWDGTGVLNPEPINQSGLAVLYVLATDPDTTNWQVVGKSKIPAGPTDDTLGDGGNIITDPTDSQDYWRIHVYYNLPSTTVVDGANAKDWLRFVIVQEDMQYEVKFNNAIFPTAGGTDNQTDYHLFPGVTYGVPGSAAATAEITENDTARFYKICDDRYSDCQYCGMEVVYNNLTSEPDFIDETPIGFKCVDDAECLHIHVTNQFGVSIENYPIILDGLNVGVTDVNGVYNHKFINASIDNTHTINICEFCFYTSGKCNQSYISIVVNDTRFAAYCEPEKPALVCSDVFPDIQIAVDEPEETVTSWLCDNDGTNYYGCVEIIGSYGYETQAECEESCIAPPVETHWKCNQIASFSGTTGSYCQQIPGPYSEGLGNNYYETEEECNEGCVDTIVTGCWECSGAPSFSAQWNEAATPDGVNCFGSMTGFDSAVAAGSLCVAPPPYLYVTCNCEQVENVNFVFPNNGIDVGFGQQSFADYDACYEYGQANCKYSDNGDDLPEEANWITDVIGVVGGQHGDSSTEYPYYTDANIPDSILNVYSSALSDIVAGTAMGGFLENNNRVIMVPIYWPGILTPENVDYRIGSNMEFTMLFRVTDDADDGMGNTIHPFGVNTNFASDNLTDTDHDLLFYVMNKTSVLQQIGLGATSFSGGDEFLTDFYEDQNDSPDAYIDYVTVDANPNEIWGQLQDWEGQNVRLYYVDVKFNYDLAITQGGLNPNEMPTMVGRMFYIPMYIVDTIAFGQGSYGLNNDVHIQFIPPEEGSYYVTAADPISGEAVDYGINGGIGAEIISGDP